MGESSLAIALTESMAQRGSLPARVPSRSRTSPTPTRSLNDRSASSNEAFGAVSRTPALQIAYGLGRQRSVNMSITTSPLPPTVSPRDFINPNLDAADLSWAHVLFCDVSVPLNDPDLLTKVSPRTALGCHLGYDHTRRGHFVYVPSLRRISTYRVASWCGESSFTIAKTISADTPVTYHTLHDLQCGDATRRLLPRLQNALAANINISSAEEGEESKRACAKEGGSHKEGEPHEKGVPDAEVLADVLRPQGLDTLNAVRNDFEQQRVRCLPG